MWTEGACSAEHPRGSRARILLDPRHYEGPSTERVQAPALLGAVAQGGAGGADGGVEVGAAAGAAARDVVERWHGVGGRAERRGEPRVGLGRAELDALLGIDLPRVGDHRDAHVRALEAGQ